MSAYDVGKLQEYFKDRLLIDVSLKSYNSFKTGGNADIAVFPHDTDELIFLLKELKEKNIPYTVIGNGTNIIVSDLGVEGAVIILSQMRNIEIHEHTISAHAGDLLSETAFKAMKRGLSGLEFASGIPGSVGGGIFMNAGAYGSEIKDVLTSVTVLDEEYRLLVLPAESLSFGYRTSIFQKNGCIILSAVFHLRSADPEEIRGTMNALNEQRRNKQPLDFPSAGSTFKRPEGHYAAKLIEDCGLKGYRLGGAMVSEKHAGFVINYDNAATADIMSLIEYIQKCVYDKYKISLEPEIRFIGRTKR